MTKKENTIGMSMTIKISSILVGAFLLAIISCEKQSKDFDIKVDLAKEMGANMFSPNTGDSIFIVGNFNEWDNTAHPLTISKNEWIYGIKINDMVDLNSTDVQPFDTLEFKFYIKSENPSKLLNTGWESIENRKYMIGEVLIEKPTLLYNDINQVEEKRNVTFTVGMSNQKVLGFFEPDSGDIVVVTGSFLDWDPIGIPLERTSRRNVYSVTVPVPNDQLEYKFRILSKRKVILPVKGWENSNNRILPINQDRVSFVEFNDVSRVARFQIDASKIIKDKKFNPELGEKLQIGLLLDGNEILSSYLYNSEGTMYETSVIIPETVLSISWRLKKNTYQDLTGYYKTKVSPSGLVISY